MCFCCCYIRLTDPQNYSNQCRRCLPTSYLRRLFQNMTKPDNEEVKIFLMVNIPHTLPLAFVPMMRCFAAHAHFLVSVTLTKLLNVLFYYGEDFKRIGRNTGTPDKYIVTYRPTDRQRLGKHILVGANACNIRMSIARQRISKHA
jgi:hypothetical protein